MGDRRETESECETERGEAVGLGDRNGGLEEDRFRE